MLVTEKLRQDIESFLQRMLQEPSLNAVRWEPKSGELEEKVRLLRLRHAELQKELLKGGRDEVTIKKSKAQKKVQGQENGGDSSSERLRMRLVKKT